MNRPQFYSPRFCFEILILQDPAKRPIKSNTWHIDQSGRQWANIPCSAAKARRYAEKVANRRGVVVFDSKVHILEELLLKAQ